MSHGESDRALIKPRLYVSTGEIVKRDEVTIS